jgi:hypothetical protein
MENGTAPTTRRTIKAAIGYLAIVFFAAFLLGTLRVLAIVPRLGVMPAVLLELPVVLAISWVTCRWAIHRYSVPDTIISRITMGGLAFVLLMGLELGFSVLLFKQSVAGHLATYRTLPGATGLLAQIGFALMPLVQRCRGQDTLA